MSRLLGSARMLLLVAPAGYGKTTLARQWAEKVGAGWLGANLASADVAALARSLANALEFCAPGLSRRVDETIRAMQHPAHELERLADVFVCSLPDTGPVYLAIDDYQLVDGAPAAERLVATVAEHPALRLLIASRTRPRWVTARQSVYGEILELRRAELSLDPAESAEVLGNAPDAEPIVALADGWPAVIGLVAVAGAPGAPPADAIAATLYDYLAEESFANASPETREALLRLCLLPPLDRTAFRAAFGETSSKVAREAARTGLGEAVRGTVELHPLARAFLVDRVRNDEGAECRAVDAVRYTVERGAWDEAFAVIDLFELHDELDGLITASLRDLVTDGRIETLERYSRYAVAKRKYATPVVDLVDGEIAFRDGLLTQALTLGLASASCVGDDHPLRPRAHVLAGRAAAFDPEEAYRLHGLALEDATTIQDKRDAMWGQCLALIYLEDQRSEGATRQLETLEFASSDDRLRSTTARLLVRRLGVGFSGSPTIGMASKLVGRGHDAQSRTAFANVFGYMLALRGRYAEAERFIDVALREAEEFGLKFATPHLLCTKALAELGLRRFSRADGHLRTVEALASDVEYPDLELNTRALRARILLTQHRIKDSLDATVIEFDRVPTRATYGEYLATRAMTLAVANEPNRAREMASVARETTNAVEVRTLAATAEAIAAILEDDTRASAAAMRALELAAEFDTWDGLICGMRAAPLLAKSLGGDAKAKRHLPRVLGRSRDDALMRAAGLSRPRQYGRGELLSPRERDVMDLMKQGLSNKEIGDTLFIATSTAKVHVSHILQKLRARSRAQAVARYAAEMSDGTDSSSAGSSG
jgi:LuxR family transcriptional regulator, maltose regulon positive regulatory protein